MSVAFPVLDGYPRGWFALAFAEQLSEGATCTAFDLELRYGRDASGRPTLSSLADGATLPVEAHSGMVFAWFDPDGGPPRFDCPRIEGYGTDAWTPWTVHSSVVATQPREVIENIVDRAHFGPVHRAELESFEVSFDAHRVHQHTSASADGVHGGSDTFVNHAIYHGPGILISDMRGRAHTVMLASHYPVDERHVRLNIGLSFEVATAFAKQRHRDHYAATLIDGFLEDVAIWENKRYLIEPMLCDGDGPIMKLRRWCGQFYGAV